MKTYERITDLIGKTPLLKLNNYIAEKSLGADIYAKLEYLNPAGSVKDRVARAMIEDAEKKGVLKPVRSSLSRQAEIRASVLPRSPRQKVIGSF